MTTGLDTDLRQGTASALVAPGVHLVDSVALASPEEVFRTVAASLGDRMRRIPDG